MKAILFFYVIIYLLLTCSKPEPRQPHKPLYILPSGCYRYRGIPSFPREQELMKNRRTEHLSAYDPLYLSYRKKWRYSIPVSLCKLLLINAIIAMGKLLVSK